MGRTAHEIVKVARNPADHFDMRVERLVIEAGDSTFTLDLHPRLTVVAGMGRVERDSLIGEMIGALGGGRPGVHVELEERKGRHLAVFRPTTGRPRVVDVDHSRDVTSEFTTADGTCDLLGRLGLDNASARRVMRFDAADLAASSNRAKTIAAVAALDQDRVWAAAEELHRAEGQLAEEAETLGTAPEDAAVIDEVEARHVAFENAVDSFERTRRRTFRIGGIAAIATLPAAMLAGTAGLLFAAVAVASVVASLVSRARVARAETAEERALEQAGASSYLGFHLQRVNGLLANDASRRALMQVAAARRSARAEWRSLAGDIPVEWALANRDEILAAAQRRHEVDADATVTGPRSSQTETGEVAQALMARMAEVRAVAGEGLPLVLDDPFRSLGSSMTPMLLELLGRAAGEPQIVLLTEDEDVARWARLEALTGEVALIEPVLQRDDATILLASHDALAR